MCRLQLWQNPVTLVRFACNGNNILKFQSIAAGDFGVYRKDKWRQKEMALSKTNGNTKQRKKETAGKNLNMYNFTAKQ